MSRKANELLAALKHLVDYVETLEAHGLIDLTDDEASAHDSVMLNAVAAVRAAEGGEE